MFLFSLEIQDSTTLLISEIQEDLHCRIVKQRKLKENVLKGLFSEIIEPVGTTMIINIYWLVCYKIYGFYF